jgi:hypothetical protein
MAVLASTQPNRFRVKRITLAPQASPDSERQPDAMRATILLGLRLCTGLISGTALWCSAVSAAPAVSEAAPAEGTPAGRDVAAEAGSGQAEPADSTEQTGNADQVWRGNVDLYMFAPLKLDTTTTIRGRTAEADLDLGDVLSALQWASSLRASVEQGRLGVLTDLYYTKLGDEAATTSATGDLTGKAEIDAQLGIYDFALRYRFGEPETAVGKPGQFSIVPYAGVRVIDTQLDVDAQVLLAGSKPIFTAQGSVDRTWAQPLVGAQASVFLTPKLRAFARADIAGFGISGSRDLSGNAQLGLGYAVGNNTDINLSWRYMGIEYNNGESPDNGFKLTQNGVQLGVKFYF